MSVYAYGSRLIPLDRHKARVRCVGVDQTGSVLASGDEDGYFRVWTLGTRDDDPSSFLKVGGLLKGASEL